MRAGLLALIPLLFWSAVASAAPPRVFVLYLDDDIHRSSRSVYREPGGPDESSTVEWETPAIDAMAAEGVRLTNMRVYGLCSQTRVAVLGYGDVRRETNLHGRVQSTNFPPGNSIEINPYAHNLFRQAQDLGYQVAYFGKLHVGKDRIHAGSSETFIEALGADVAEAIVQANIDDPNSLEGSLNYPESCLGHNYWVKTDLDGNVSEEFGHSTDVIIGAAKNYIQNVTTGNHFVVVATTAPHSPVRIAFDVFGNPIGSGPCPNGRQPHDAPIGSVAKTLVDLYGEMVEHVDSGKAEINQLLSLGPGGSDMACSMSDNGVTYLGASDECFDSYGAKGTPYPCGTQVEFVCQGGGIVSTGEVMDGLYTAVDIPKTINALLGGNGGGVADGMSFANCLLAEQGYSPSNCPDHAFTDYEEWRPMGGSSGDLRRPPLASDPVGTWNEHERAAYTFRFDGDWLLHRVFDVDDPSSNDVYYERFFEISTADPYLSNLNAPLAETAVPGGGPIQASDFATTPRSDELDALHLLQDRVDAMGAREGRNIPVFSGVSY